MTSDGQLRAEITAELEAAVRFRKEGNEGRARVCARRAAGWAVGWYVEKYQLAETHSNALEHLRWLANYPHADSRLNEAARRLVTKLKPDGSLPFEYDLLDEAHLIIESYLA